MSATTNTIVTDDVVTALDVEFNSRFDGEINQLTEILGIAQPEILSAGTALYQYTITGELNNTATPDIDDRPGTGESSGTAYVEGDEVALSHYKVDKLPIGEITMMPYRKRTTAAAVLKGGFEQSVLRTDNKMLADVRAAIVSQFFDFINKKQAGEETVTGATLQAALAQIDAELADRLETNNDSAGRIIHFVNRFDIADYLATANVGLATVYGMQYLKDFLGISDIVVTSKVAKGNIVATPVENIRMFAGDFAELASAGLGYTVSDSGLVGVHHEPAYNRVSAETHVLTGVTMFPEVVDYLVHGEIGATPSA